MGDDAFFQLTNPKRVFGRELLTSPQSIPASRGLYAWYFRNFPAIIPAQDCIHYRAPQFGELTLLYVGIAPSRPTSNSNLRTRIRQHYASNAYASTLRLTLGALLVEESRFPLQRVGGGKRVTLGIEGEQWLNDWMERNAFVSWVEHSAPWEVENEIISHVSLPLNIQGNLNHRFYHDLMRLRREARTKALP